MGSLMSLALLIKIIPLALLVSACTVGVFSHRFNDTLTQRIGLSLLAMGAALQIVELFKSTGSTSPCTMMLYGAAVFASSTFLKFCRSNKGVSR